MDDVYAINVAKTDFREAYNTGDVESLMAILDPGLIDWSDGRCSGFGEGGRKALRDYLHGLFARYTARLVPIIIEIRLMGDAALEYGWHELTLTPKAGGEAIYRRTRYVDVWRKGAAGQWKLAVFMDNADVPDRMAAAQAS